MQLAVIIPAAGSSSRFNTDLEPSAAALGLARSKIDEDLGGKSVLQRTIERFKGQGIPADRPEIAAIIVPGPHDDEAFDRFKSRHGDMLALFGVTVCKGGKSHRYESVAAAIEHIPAEATHVAVHDAARPVTPHAVIDRVLEAASIHGAIIPSVPVPDTLKKLGEPQKAESNADPLAAILGATDDDGLETRPVLQTVDRTDLALVQTPQVFEIELFKRAYGQPDLASTDDAGLVERLGETVHAVEGDPLNIKITRPRDLDLARAIGGFRTDPGRASHKRF